MTAAVRRCVVGLVLLTSPLAAASWKSEGPFFGSVTSIAVDPSNPDRLWASTHGGGVWRSNDGGQTWRLSGKLLSDRVVTYVVVQPKTNTLWAGADGGGLARSTDAGETWSWIRTDLAQSPHPPAFDRSGSIWVPDVNLHKRSADGGTKWTEFRVSGGDVRTFAFHPTDPNVIWAGGTNGRAGLWKSSDGGLSWKQLGIGLPEFNAVERLIIDPSQPNTLYMVARRGAFKSTDNGENWTPMGGQIQEAAIKSLTLNPSMPQTLFAGTSKGFFRSNDGGTTWTRVAGGLTTYIVTTLVLHPTMPDVMWLGTSGAGIYKTADGGKTWSDSNRGFAASWIEKVWGDPVGSMFAQTSRGLFRGDGKGTWSELLQPFDDDEANVNFVIFDAKTPTIVHAGSGWSYYRSMDGGARWTEVVKPFQDPKPTFGSLVIDPKNPKTLYCADRNPSSGDPQIFKSTDGGVRWKASNRGVGAGGVLALIADAAGTLIALGSEGGLWRSTDGATTWTAGGRGLPGKGMKGMAIDPTNPTRLYVVAEQGFYHSEDGGLSFTAQKVEGPEAVAVDSKGTVYLGNGDGVSRSSDGGRTFSPFNEGLTNLDVRALHIAGTRIYAGTAGGGVFSSEIN
jgi:photosystem II stability/assembly factor-like uncharacterized protein